MSCEQHDKVYVETFEQGRVLWICRNCLKTAGEADDGDPNRTFDNEEYFRLIESLHNTARDRNRASRSS